LHTTYAGNCDALFFPPRRASDLLVYSTYLGGFNPDTGYRIALDSVGSAYVTGQTSSINFPTTTGAFQTTYAGGGDAFVAKIAEAIASSTPGKVTGGGYIEPDGTMSPAELLIQTGTNASVGGKA